MKYRFVKRLQRHWCYRILLLAMIFSTRVVNAQPTLLSGEDSRPTGYTWSKVTNMSDEFDDGSIDASKWQTEPVANGWVWIGRPPGLFSADAVKEADDNLQVTVSVLDAPTTINGNEFLYQGAIVRSIDPGEVGWYYEARMKGHKTEMSNTFWLMTNNSDCYKKHEIDIQECIGHTTELTYSWAATWDRIFHSNAIYRTTSCVTQSVQRQGSVATEVPNHERYFVYGAWRESSTVVHFYLDGVYQYSINPSVPFDMPMWIQMAIETYDWNPVPEGGGKIATETEEGRTVKYDWVRVWRLTESPGVLDTDSNLVKNPGFENANFDRWILSDSAEIDTTNEVTGLFAAKLNGTSTLSQQVRVLPGEDYIFTAQLKSEDGSALELGVQSHGGVSESTSSTATSYQQKNLSFTTAASDTVVEIYIRGDAESGTYYADNFIITGAIPPSTLPGRMVINANNGLILYPNPLVKGYSLTLQTEIERAGALAIEVYDSVGQQVGERNFGMLQPGTCSLTLSSDELGITHSGLYFVKMFSGNMVSLRKLVVQE